MTVNTGNSAAPAAILRETPATIRLDAPAAIRLDLSAAVSLDQLLRASGLPWIEARMLAERAFGLSPVQLATRLRDMAPSTHTHTFGALAARRRAGEPVAYILGEREFYGRRFAVTPDVLIPRPETELLCEALLERISTASPLKPASILDLGTGSGAIAVTLACERPAWQVTAADQSTAALAVARSNAQRLCPAASVRFLVSDWFVGLAGERYDAIISNPPYIGGDDEHLAQGDLRFEPPAALRAGPQGMDALNAIAARAPIHLHPGGWLLLEHGFAQGSLVREALHANGLTEVVTLTDLAGCERVTLGRRAHAMQNA